MQVGDIGGWLDGLGLGAWRQLFSEHGIDGTVLAELTEADLQAIGLPLGVRRKLLRAIAAQTAAPPLGENGPPAAERRNVTVLACDMVDSTALATRLDPEDLRTITHGYMAACAAVVASLGGYVASYQGDGLLAYFGYPQAQEDAAERAVRAALRLVEQVRGVAAAPGVALHSRLGIATGLMVIGFRLGDSLSRPDAAVGEVLALAVRLQALAPPDGIVIGQATRTLLGEAFTLEDLGPQPLKGFAAPQPAWRVLGEAAAETRFAAIRRSRSGELVNRDSELAILLTRWRLAREGQAQVVLLAGEPGLGKSRLIEALRVSMAEQPHTVVLLQCAAHAQASGLRPVIDWIERAAGCVAADAAPARQAKLAALPGLDAAATAVVADLLSVAGGEPPAPATVGSLAERRARILAALAGLLLHVPPDRPKLLVLEDAHWSDAFTRDLLERVVVQATSSGAGEAALFVLVTCRTELTLDWAARPGIITIALDRLQQHHAAQMIEGLGRDRLSPALRQRIAERAGGVPLFVEELTRAVLEAGAETAPVPATLQDTLMARLDRLGPAKLVAQTAAALGRAFRYDWLASCLDGAGPRLDAALSALVAAGLLTCRGTPPMATYGFRHALIQDAAYHSLLRSDRVALHGRIAGQLERDFPHIAAAQPELVAQHYTAAGETDLALLWWERAAAHAIATAASAEAVGHLRTALSLLDGLADPAARVPREIALRQALITPLVTLGGWSSADCEANVDRLGALLEDAPPSLEAVAQLYSQAALRLLRSDLARAEEFALRSLRLAQRSGIPNTPFLGQRILGYTALVRGDIAAADRWFSVSAADYDPTVNRNIWPGAPLDPYACMLAQDGLVLLQQGRLAAAAQYGQQALAEARRLNAPTTLAYVLVHLALAGLISGDIDAAAPVAQALTETVAQAEWLRRHAEMLAGWLAAKAGALADGLARIDAGLEISERMQDRMWTPLYVLCKAEALIAHGQPAAALDVLDQCERLISATGQRFALAELHRLRGLALGATAAGATAEASLHAALAIARQQGQRIYELRAAVSLAARRAADGESAAAAALLAPLLAAFPAAADCPDLRAARALLLPHCRP